MSEEGATRRQIEEAREKIQQIDDAEKDYIAYDLLNAISIGDKYMKVYKQMKMYNDDELNPVLRANK